MRALQQLPALILVMVLVACTSLAVSPREIGAFKNAETRWSEYQSDNFTLISDVSAERAKVFLEELEDFRNFVRQELGPIDGRRPRLTVIAPKTRRGFSVFADPNTIGGQFFRTIDTDFMVINLSVTRQSNRDFNGAFTAGDILRHEYTHAVVADLPGKPVPLWLNEGLAEYYATARRDGDEYIIGKPLERRVRDLLQDRSLSRRTRRLNVGRRSVLIGSRQGGGFVLAPLEQIVDATHVSNVYRNTRDRTSYHAQAWLLTHRLYRDEEGQATLQAYHEARREIGQESDVLEAVLGEELEDYDDFLWDIATDEDFPSRRVKAPPLRDVHVRRIGAVSEAQMWCNVGRYKGFAADARQAKRIFRLALQKDPKNVCALSHLSKLESWDFNFQQAEALTQRAEALELDDPFTPLSRAMLVYNLTRDPDFSGEIDDKDLDEAIAAAKRTIELDPAIALTYLVHGVLALRKSELSPPEMCEALASVREAARLAPQNQSPDRLLIGILAARLGQFEEAEQNFAYVQAWGQSDDQRDFATENLELVKHLRAQETTVHFDPESELEFSPYNCAGEELVNVPGSDHRDG